MPENRPTAAAWDRHLKQLASTCLDRRRLPDEDLEGLRQLAATAAGRGTALRFLVAEYLTSVCRVWTDLSGAGPALEPDDLREVGSSLIRAIGEATVALTEGYETAHRAAIRGEEAMRREFVDDLLDGRTGLGRLAERAERFELRLVGPHSVAVARAGKPFRAGDDTSRYVEEALAARFSTQDVLITTKDSLLVCVSPGAVPEVTDFFAGAVRHAVDARCRIAVSRPRPGPSGIVRSYQEARSTLDLATQLGLTASCVHASDLLVFQVLGRDRAAITDLVATVLGGLEGATWRAEDTPGNPHRVLRLRLPEHHHGPPTRGERAHRHLSARAHPAPHRPRPHRSRPAVHPADRRPRRPPPGLAGPAAAALRVIRSAPGGYRVTHERVVAGAT
ncbi:PucR family transcriptional regulator [Streptomyces swartbergensis]|uniref:PucR family transcriptional regulator n=1 Tax=Streptomyces swartbergensis TaxID=487165 RepID=UPI003CC67037